MTDPGIPRPQIRLLARAMALLAPLVTACSDRPDETVLNLYRYSENFFDEVVARCNAEAAGRYTIVVDLLPRDADGQREQLVRRLAARDDAMDILGLDVTWTAEFAEADWILEWTGTDRDAAVDDVLPGPLASMTWKGGVHAVAANTNVQLLWYRRDLVPTPPTTWDEMLEMAEALADAGQPHLIAFTGAQYEGLVVGFNTLLASYGGTLVNEDGTRATVDDRTVQALTLLGDFAASAGASAALGNSREAEAQALMENGYAAFELNWPYVYAAMKLNNPAMSENFAFTNYPRVVASEPARVTTGGLNFAVSAFSKHPDEAREAILCMRNRESQKFMALNGGTPPALASLYSDPELVDAYPMLGIIQEQLENAVARPKTPFYQNVSTIVAAALSPPSRIDPEAVAAKLERQIQDALDSKGVLP
jgi:multiple sugar transport system substrate-binding protein